MELFSEIYNCYYQVLRHLLCSRSPVTIENIRKHINSEGFEESMLSILPKLESGTWNLFEKDGKLYRSKLISDFVTPVSALEKSYLKALLSDPRIGLFLNPQQLATLHHMLSSVQPLWRQDQFYYFDRFTDGDPYHDETYCHNFRTLLQGLKNRQYVDIDYTSPQGNRVHHYYIPARLEYSVKNDKFRLIALENTKHSGMKLDILNVSRMQSVRLAERYLNSSIDVNAFIHASYYKEPVTLHIINKRNALERAMLHFANYEKNTKKIDENTYECLIYYNKNMETELLIEVLSFGPMIKVTGNDKFLQTLKSRLQKQKQIPLLFS